MGVITLIGALAMAGVAAWFAIVGIVAFFSGLPLAAMIMGIVIEIGKLLGISWVYRNWDNPTKLKYVALPFIFMMMVLTSAGIFGFLSKAHLEQNVTISQTQFQSDLLDQRINSQTRKINDTNIKIQQLNSIIDTLVEFDKISGPNGARKVLENQQESRSYYTSIIEESQEIIDKLRDEKIIVDQSLNEKQIKLGPIKYVAALIYDDPEEKIEEASRVLIMLFIFVFDPMAILLLMMANYSLMNKQKKNDKKNNIQDKELSKSCELIEELNLSPPPLILELEDKLKQYIKKNNE